MAVPAEPPISRGRAVRSDLQGLWRSMEAFVAGVNIVFMRDTGRGEQRCFFIYAAGISAIPSPRLDG
ncbi:MAG TPA: hypothetical protein DEU95_04905 [Chloroflexi bacterium]|nr:hypothetical protein [Chloroflexota bacterium]